MQLKTIKLICQVYQSFSDGQTSSHSGQRSQSVSNIHNWRTFWFCKKYWIVKRTFKIKKLYVYSLTVSDNSVKNLFGSKWRMGSIGSHDVPIIWTEAIILKIGTNDFVSSCKKNKSVKQPMKIYRSVSNHQEYWLWWLTKMFARIHLWNSYCQL